MTRTTDRKPRQFKLALESLDERVVPATFHASALVARPFPAGGSYGGNINPGRPGGFIRRGPVAPAPLTVNTSTGVFNASGGTYGGASGGFIRRGASRFSFNVGRVNTTAQVGGTVFPAGGSYGGNINPGQPGGFILRGGQIVSAANPVGHNPFPAGGGTYGGVSGGFIRR